MPHIIVSEADGTFEVERWIDGKPYDFQEILEVCWKRQNYIDRWKALTGFDFSPWVVFTAHPIDSINWGEVATDSGEGHVSRLAAILDSMPADYLSR